MNAPIQRRGIEDVVDGFGMYETPYFALWWSNNLMFSHCGADMNDALRMLQDNLAVLNSNGSSAVYTIKFYAGTGKDGRITRATDPVGQFNFRLNEHEERGTRAVGAVGAGNDRWYQHLEEQNKQILEQNRLLQEQLASIEEPDDEEADIMDKVGAIGEKYPWLQEHIKEGVTIIKAILNKTLGMNSETRHRATGQIAGVSNDATPTEKVNAAIKILYKHNQQIGDDLLRLADLAENDPDTFNLALKKLRAL